MDPKEIVETSFAGEMTRAAPPASSIATSLSSSSFSAPSSSTLKVGLPVEAQWDDGYWYKAIITELFEDGLSHSICELISG